MNAPSIILTKRGVYTGMTRLAPIAVFAIPFGLAYGTAAVERGLSPTLAIMLSASVFAGAAQFAALDLWTTPLPVISILLTVLAVNARHVILGAALSPWLNPLPPGKRLSSLLVLSDANFADSRQAFEKGARDVGLLVGGGLAMWLSWVSGTAMGALAGANLGDLSVLGIDVLMVAYFAALVAGDLRDRVLWLPTVAAAVVAIGTLPLLPVGWNVIVAALAGGAVGGWRYAR